MTLCRVTQLAWSVPTLAPAGTLDLSALTAAQRDRLKAQVGADAAAQPPFADDTYFGGKSLYRVVNLYEVARAVGATSVAADLRARLIAHVDRWTQPRGCDQRTVECFVYDPAGRGVVGLRPSFGSEEYNDHHFHYGYFLYTAGVLAAGDPALVQRWAPVMDLLAADIATSADGTYFPDRRPFDVYGGHSWASGTAPFGDGNNQESSSEAVTAWNGLALWARASGQEALETHATWMLSAEAASALAYWTNFPLEEPMYDGFDHTVTSLVWGGKRDYATWFSPEPSAMLGILVLPMSPVAGYLAADPERIRRNLADSAPNGFDVMFGDFLLMYSALRGPQAAAEALRLSDGLPERRVDDGNTRSYLLAFIMSRL
jgi:endoglucanase Acf2